MTTRSMILVTAAALGLAGTADAGWPFGRSGCRGGDCGGAAAGGGGHTPRYNTAAAAFGASRPQLPAFQAAPWYLYWPYDAHFLTPAPVTGAFHGAPGAGNFPVNPYFPAPAYGSYGPVPGGSPPVPSAMPAAPTGTPN